MLKSNLKLIRFDDRKVLNWVDRRQARAMNKLGAFIRTVDRRSIRKAKAGRANSGRTVISKRTGRRLYGAAAETALRTGSGVLQVQTSNQPQSGSKPGGPPRFRKRGPCTLKDGIFYGFDPSKRELVVGAHLCSSKRKNGLTVPEEIEFGSRTNRAFPHTGPALEEAVRQDKVREFLEST